MNKSHLTDGGNPDTASDNLSVHALAAVSFHFHLLVRQFALVYLRKKRHHICVQHGSEQLHVQRGVSKTLLQAVALHIVTLGMHLRQTYLIVSWNVVAESRK